MKIDKNLKKRYIKQNIFRFFGLASIAFSIFFLVIFLATIFNKGNKAFFTHKILLEIDLTTKNIIENSLFSKDFSLLSKQELIQEISYRKIIRQALKNRLMELKLENNNEIIDKILSENSDFILQEIIVKNPDFIGFKKDIFIETSSNLDIYFKYKNSIKFDEKEIEIINILFEKNYIKKFFNYRFFSATDSRQPETAGVAASLVGSFLTMIIFLVFAFPIAIMSAFYLEEFAPKNKITDIIEISINNLAAIPSIIYGLLGLCIYLQFMNFPRSSSFVGGLTLFMLVMPVIIIATRNAIRTIPQNIRDGAASLGASKMQVILHHLLPLSIPSIMTGTILAMSRALGETAPLLMIGMVAFIADIANNFMEPATTLPVQIYLWSDSAEIGFMEKTSAAILILLAFLMFFNLFAILIRKKFERKW